MDLSKPLIILSILTLPGCATAFIETHALMEEPPQTSPSCGCEHTIPRVYGGTVIDFHGMTAENLGLFALIDLPLSLVADTVILPYTIYKQVKYGVYCSTDQCKTEAPEANQPNNAFKRDAKQHAPLN